MKARVLGTAAGGGLPQWNCACARCAQARQQGTGRTQDCLAVTGTGQRWYLVNASPDIRGQLLAAPELAPGPGLRDSPVAGVLLTDGELDHTIGLLMLREGTPLAVYGPEPVLAALADSFPVRRILGPYGAVSWHPVRPGTEIALDDQLSVTPIPLSRKRPRYAQPARVADPGRAAEPAGAGEFGGTRQSAGVAGDWVVGYRFGDRLTGGALVYAPCLAAWPPALDQALAGAGCVLLDGTFFRDDEMLHATGQDRPARAMGHLPITDTAARLRSHPAPRKLYTHLNNTNPALAAGSPERASLAADGIGVADDGLTLEA